MAHLKNQIWNEFNNFKLQRKPKDFVTYGLDSQFCYLNDSIFGDSLLYDAYNQTFTHCYVCSVHLYSWMRMPGKVDFEILFLKKDERSSHLCKQQFKSSCEKKAWTEKITGFNGFQTHDPRDAGAVLYQLSYQANWELIILWVRNLPVEDE